MLSSGSIYSSNNYVYGLLNVGTESGIGKGKLWIKTTVFLKMWPYVEHLSFWCISANALSLNISAQRTNRFMYFPKVLVQKKNSQSHRRFLLDSHISFCISITKRTCLVRLSSFWVVHRPSVVSTTQLRLCVPRHWISLWPHEGGGAPGFKVNCLAPAVPFCRGMPTGTEVFWNCQVRVDYGPALGPTLKRPCAILSGWWAGSQILLS